MFRCGSSYFSQRKLNKLGKGDKVCLVEKAVLCAAESSRHSGIVRSANADPDASIMASMSSKMWKNLSSVWGLDMEIDEFGAIWIAKKNADGENPAWSDLSDRMSKIQLFSKKLIQIQLLKNVVKLYLQTKMNLIFTSQQHFS